MLVEMRRGDGSGPRLVTEFCRGLDKPRREGGKGYGYRQGDVLESEAGLPQLGLHHLVEGSQPIPSGAT